MPVDNQGLWIPPTTVHPAEVCTPHPPGYTYRDLIPEATPKTPGELLDRLYADKSGMRDWTDPNGVLCKQQEMYRDYPQYAALPIGSAGLVGNWPRPDDLPMVPVPVRETRPSANPRDVIQFKNRVWGWPQQGIKVADILQGDLKSLEGADEIVLKKFRGMGLQFIINWPGYKPQCSTIRTRLADGGAITRGGLLTQVALAYFKFFKKVEDEQLLPDTLGFHNIALHQGNNARQDSLGVQLTSLHLIKFYPTSDGYFIAEVMIV